jgi:hypothetical protein
MNIIQQTGRKETKSFSPQKVIKKLCLATPGCGVMNIIQQTGRKETKSCSPQKSYQNRNYLFFQNY